MEYTYLIIQTDKTNDNQVVVDEVSSEDTAKSIVDLQNQYCDKNYTYHYELAEPTECDYWDGDEFQLG